MSTAQQSQTAEPDAEYDETTVAAERGDNAHRPPDTTAHQHSYRTVADALITIGVLCLLAGLATPTGTDVLFALGGIGIFSGVLTAILTSDRFVSATHSEQLYTATARNYHQLCVDLDLSDRRLYVPRSTSTTTEDPSDASSRTAGRESTPDRLSADGSGPTSPHDVRLFVPAHPSQSPPATIDQPTDRVLIDAGRRGLSVTPTGSGLVAAFLTTLSEPLATEPQPLATQLSAAVVTDFELARSTTIEFDGDSSTLSVQFGDCLYDSRPLFDHPAVSVFAVGLAIGLGRSVDATITASSPLSATFRWSADSSPEESAAAD